MFAVAVNESLHNFVDSYLQFRRRWYNSRSWANSGAPTAGVVVGDGDLSRRVFMLLYRMWVSQLRPLPDLCLCCNPRTWCPFTWDWCSCLCLFSGATGLVVFVCVSSGGTFAPSQIFMIFSRSANKDSVAPTAERLSPKQHAGEISCCKLYFRREGEDFSCFCFLARGYLLVDCQKLETKGHSTICKPSCVVSWFESRLNSSCGDV